VVFFVDHRLVKLVEQSPDYDQAPDPGRPYPKEFVVDHVRGYRPTA
jgi:hypothetical protein